MALIATGFRLPFTSLRLTQEYGAVGALSNLPTYKHLGEDYSGALGSSILAAANGVVIQTVTTSPSTGFGNFVIIQHTRSDLSMVYTLYGHLDSVTVNAGQEVTIGSKIGVMGATGSADGAHLHFEVSFVNKFTQSGIYGGGYDSPTEFLTSSKSTVDPSNFIAANPVSLTHSGSYSADRLWGDATSESFYGNDGDDLIEANGGNDRLYGGNGSDRLYGGSGADVLVGGAGRDILYGGSGQDIFDFNNLNESLPGSSNRDTIADFVVGSDRIDLSGIDASSRLTGNQAFSYILSRSFSGVAGQLRMDNGIIQGDINGDRIPDFEIYVPGQDTLNVDQFIL